MNCLPLIAASHSPLVLLFNAEEMWQNLAFNVTGRVYLTSIWVFVHCSERSKAMEFHTFLAHLLTWQKAQQDMTLPLSELLLIHYSLGSLPIIQERQCGGEDKVESSDIRLSLGLTLLTCVTLGSCLQVPSLSLLICIWDHIGQLLKDFALVQAAYLGVHSEVACPDPFPRLRTLDYIRPDWRTNMDWTRRD